MELLRAYRPGPGEDRLPNGPCRTRSRQMRGGQSANGKVTRARSRKSQRSPNSRGQRSQDAMVVTAFPVLQGRRRGHAGTSSWALEE